MGEGDKLKMHIEAVLFLSGEPVPVSNLCKIFEKKPEEINLALAELEADLSGRGVRLLKNKSEVMLGTAPESSGYCETLVKEEMNRSIGKAGLETLAIILYRSLPIKEGISRAEIDYIRGVNSAFTLRNLSIRGLVERKINPKDKRSFVYTPAMQLLQYLGISKKEDLPNVEEFVKQMENAIQDFNAS